jgi:predicted P-loop ATPase
MNPAAAHERNPAAALARLRKLVSLIRSPERQAVTEGSVMPGAIADWDHYLRTHLAIDAAHLGRLEENVLDVELQRVGDSGRGWSARAALIRSAVRKTVRARPELRVVGEDEAPPDIDREPAVWAQLARTGEGRATKAQPTLSNAARILELDSRWRERITYDDNAKEILIDDQPVKDADPVNIAIWLDRTYGVNVGPKVVLDAIASVAQACVLHPVRGYLNGLAWDGVRRIDTWALTHLDAQTSSEDHRRIVCIMARKWLISAVARVMSPGCQVKAGLLLMGDQYVGKSPVFRVLAGRWYEGGRIDVRSKEGQAAVRGVWIWEVAEVGDWFKGRSAEELKAFLDQVSDRYRPVWGRVYERYDRQLVWGATDNDDKVLRDPTGHSRWYPVLVGNPNLDLLRRDRDQLWAEALQAYAAGSPWHLIGEEVQLHAMAAARHEAEEAWKDILSGWLFGDDERPSDVTTTECLRRLETAGRFASTATPNAIGRWLRTIGWVERDGNRAERALGRRKIWSPGPKSAPR